MLFQPKKKKESFFFFKALMSRKLGLIEAKRDNSPPWLCKYMHSICTLELSGQWQSSTALQPVAACD